MWRCSVKSSLPWRLLFRLSLIGGLSVRRLKRKLQRLLTLPLMLMLCATTISLPGCATSQAPTNSPSSPPTVITKPVLNSLVFDDDGGMCMDKHDSAELLIYIRALERELGLR